MQGNRKERVVKDEMKHTPSNCLPTECLYGRIDLYVLYTQRKSAVLVHCLSFVMHFDRFFTVYTVQNIYELVDIL